MPLAKLTKKDKKQIALGMIYHSTSVDSFGDSITIGTVSFEDEQEILNFIRIEQMKFLKRLDKELSVIKNVDDMIKHFHQKNIQKQKA